MPRRKDAGKSTMLPMARLSAAAAVYGNAASKGARCALFRRFGVTPAECITRPRSSIGSLTHFVATPTRTQRRRATLVATPFRRPPEERWKVNTRAYGETQPPVTHL